MYSVPRNYFFDGHKHYALQEVVTHCKHHIYRNSFMMSCMKFGMVKI